MGLIATEFLSMHPATALWHAQRDTCRACRHHLPSLEGVRDRGGERCARQTARFGVGGRGRSVQVYCCDARAPGQPCGPDAAKFAPKGGPR